MPKKYDIIIPSWNQSEYVIPCLNSVRYYSDNYRVIFIDNGTSEDELDKILPVLSLLPHTYIRNEENVGFVKATNKGIQASDADNIILMNNDAEATVDWLDTISRPCVDRSYIGIVGPVTNTKNLGQGMLAQREGYNILGYGHFITFFCTLIKRRVIEEIGLLDEAFGVGFCDDLEYCLRAQDYGWDIAISLDLLIPHRGRSTFNKLYNEKEIASMLSVAHEKLSKIRRGR